MARWVVGNDGGSDEGKGVIVDQGIQGREYRVQQQVMVMTVSDPPNKSLCKFHASE